MNDTKKIRQELRNSLDIAVLRRDLILVAGVDALVLVIFAFTAGGIANEEFLLAATLVCGITIIPVLVYSIWAAAKIFRQPEGYVFGRCKLSQPHQYRLSRGGMYFTIVFEYPNGEKEILNTRPIFASYGMAGPLLEDYINRTVEVAYNEDTDSVVVIG